MPAFNDSVESAPWMPEIRSAPNGNGAALCATFYATNIEISRYDPLMSDLLIAFHFHGILKAVG